MTLSFYSAEGVPGLRYTLSCVLDVRRRGKQIDLFFCIMFQMFSKQASKQSNVAYEQLISMESGTNMRFSSLEMVLAIHDIVNFFRSKSQVQSQGTLITTFETRQLQIRRRILVYKIVLLY